MDYSIKLLSDEARSLNGKIMEDIYRHVDINKLKKSIHIFQNMDTKSLSNKELEANIDEVMNLKLDGGITLSTNLLEYSIFSRGTRFYRVRKLTSVDMPNRNLKKYLHIGIRRENM